MLGLRASMLAFAMAGQPAQGPAAVELELAGAAADTAAMGAVLDELFSDGAVQLTVTTAAQLDLSEIVDPAADEAASAHVWISLADPPRASVFIGDRTMERVLIRHLEFSELDAVAFEEIALIIDSSIRALIAGGTIGVGREQALVELGVSSPEQGGEQTRPDPPDPPDPDPGAPIAPAPQPPAVDPDPNPSARREFTWGADAGYRIRALGLGVPQHGPTLGVYLGAPVVGPLRLAGTFDARFHLPVVVQGSGLGVRLVGGYLGGGARALTRLTPWLDWSLEASLGGDIVRAEAIEFSPQADGSSPVSRLTPVTSIATGLVFVQDRERGVRISIQALVDIDLAGFRYVSTDGDVVFSPWRFRPGAMLTIGWGAG